MAIRNAMERQLSPAYIEWQRARALEIEQEKEAQAAAEQAAINANPTLSAQRSMDELAIAEQGIALNVPLTDEYLAQFGTVQRGPCTDDELEAAISYFKRSTKEYVHTQKNFDAIAEFIERNDLNFGRLDSYKLAYAVLTHWGAFPDTERPESKAADFLKGYGPLNHASEISDEDAKAEGDRFLQTGWRRSNKNSQLLLSTLSDAGLLPFAENLQTVAAYLGANNLFPEAMTMSVAEQMAQRSNDFRTKVIGTVDGVSYTEKMLSGMRSHDELRIRRMLEKGHSGSSAYDDFLDIKQRQATRDVEIARKGEEQ